MSLVTTASRSRPESSRQIVAMSELLPVPTGPHTPSRSALVAGASMWSGTEQPPGRPGVGLRPPLDLRRAGGRDLVRLGETGDRLGQPVDVGQQLQAPH